MRPVKIKVKNPERLHIDWDNGRQSDIDLPKLRDACPCATCREEEESGAIVVRPRAENKYLIAGIKMIGSYAVGITWKDGHNTGIYDFHYLLDLEE